MTKEQRQHKAHELRQILAEWYNALRYAQAGKAYTIGTRQLTRYDLKDIRDMIDWLEDKIDELEAGVGRTCLVSPRRCHVFR